jgi:3-phenylpropionate/trans-cinnamate dioxygenase ferredoxin reductase component
MLRGQVIIVGAGHAGGTVACALHAAGFQGRIVVLGAERHPPYERPPLSKELLAGSLPVEKTYLKPIEWYGSAGIDLRMTTEVVAINRASRRAELSTGQWVPYDILVLATGARPRRLPLAEAVDDRIFYLRSIADSLALRARLMPGRRLAVVGAGLIGLEVASTAKKAGCHVTVLEAASRPLARVVPPDIGDYIASLHRRNGVDLRFNCGVVAIDPSPGGCLIHTTDNGSIEVDAVAVGIGVMPNQELAEQAGIVVDDGIVVDEFGETSDPAIYAVGDVTRHFNSKLGRAVRLESWQNAQNQAIAVAKVIAGGDEPYAEVPWLWTDQHGINVQVAGAPSEWTGVAYRGDATSDSFLVFQLLDKSVVGAIAVNAARDMRFARMLINSGKPIDSSVLADSSIKLPDLCR